MTEPGSTSPRTPPPTSKGVKSQPAKGGQFLTGADTEVIRRLLADPDERALRVLRLFLGAASGYLMLKPMPSQLATRALLSLGPGGVAILKDALLERGGERVRYRASVLAALWQVSRGRGIVDVMPPRATKELLELPLPDGTQDAAIRAVRDLFAEALLDPDAFSLVANFADRVATDTAISEDSALDATPGDVMSLFGEAAIKLSPRLLDELAQLVSEEGPEEVYQAFLTANPALIDPLAAEVIPKQRLGLEFATDFAVRRHDDRWVLVEIERPQDRIFTNSADFRERFNHAFGQVLDFLMWVDENVAYAQRLMPGITAPTGMLVIGRRTRLSARERAKLRSFVGNSQRVEVQTYDDLLAGGASLYENLHYRRP